MPRVTSWVVASKFPTGFPTDRNRLVPATKGIMEAASRNHEMNWYQANSRTNQVRTLSTNWPRMISE